MAISDVSWLRSYAGKLDVPLREAILKAHRVSRPSWHFAQQAVLAYRRRFRRIPVILKIEPGCSKADRAAIMETLKRCGCRRVRRHALIDACSAEIPLGALEQLAADKRVHRLYLDAEVRALLDVAAPTVRAPEVWDIGYRGRGVTIAIVDTGIYPHPDFTVPTNRIIGFVDLVNGRQSPYDDNGHGTHVAGIAAGNGYESNGRYTGIAPEASLVGVKVLDASGSGTLSNVIAGIEWCVQNRERYGIRIITLSLGAPARSSYRDDPVAQAAGAAWAAGIVVCAAAGNEGPLPRTIASPGIHPRIITVGATDDRRSTRRSDDRVAEYSSRGPTLDGIHKPDVVAPGTDITAANAIRTGPGRRAQPYVTHSGTSMATPVCSGIAALLLEWRPRLTPDEVKEHIREAAEDLGFPIDEQGSGLVDALGALSSVQRGKTPALERRSEQAALSQ